MAKKNDRTGQPQHRHRADADRDPQHFEPRAADLPKDSLATREPTPFFFAAYTNEDEVPPDQPRD